MERQHPSSFLVGLDLGRENRGGSCKHINIKIIVLTLMLLGNLYPVEARGETAVPSSEVSPVELIYYYSREYKVDSEVMLKIANAESGFRNVPNFLYDGEDGHYTAYGIFQITRTTYKAFCGDPSERLDVEKNIICAMKIASSSGLHHWNESIQWWNH